MATQAEWLLRDWFPMPRSSRRQFPPAPRADPAPPARPAPRAGTGPARPARAPARPVRRHASLQPRSPVDDGLIRSTALKPELNFQFVPDRAVVTESEVMLQFDVVLTNSGAAPARDVLVEAKLVPAHAGQDQEIAAFFQQPRQTGDRMAGIPPLGKVSLKSAVRLPLDQLHSFEVDGRKLFVPLVAFNILFRWSGGEGQASASFLVGRGNDERREAGAVPARPRPAHLPRPQRPAAQHGTEPPVIGSGRALVSGGAL